MLGSQEAVLQESGAERGGEAEGLLLLRGGTPLSRRERGYLLHRISNAQRVDSLWCYFSKLGREPIGGFEGNAERCERTSDERRNKTH